jgi:hypothetical protein
MITRTTMMTLALAAAVATVGCGDSGAPKPATSTNANSAAPSRDTAKVEPKVLKDEAGPDGSRIVIRQLDSGDTVAVRRWEFGAVKKVTKRTKSGETRAVRVVLRGGNVYRLDDPAAIEHAMDWTGDQIAEAAKKLGKSVDDPASDADDGDEPVANSNRK